MNTPLNPPHASTLSTHFPAFARPPNPTLSILKYPFSILLAPPSHRFNHLSVRCFSSPSTRPSHADSAVAPLRSESPVLRGDEPPSQWNVGVGRPNVPLLWVPAPSLSLSDQAFFLVAFIACTTSVALTSLVIAAVPTLHAMGKAATSLSKLADTVHEELPSTMAAIRLSGMEISDLTLELSDLSQEIADGVNKSAQAVQAAEAGIKQIGALARQQTISMIQERASLPIISLRPVVAGAAKKTSHAVGRATRTFLNFLARGDLSSEANNSLDRVDI